ncbi:Protein ariadne-2 [Trametes pubescens]|uniref:RBR-type E3 ubiquitin transferase n=1 Tax=Trametes pubescens TaxID=154538 RepID=A0A1M2VYD6_TRAPU|nr:Protein ariadne-2 [Trametes pubescens]
MSGKESLATQGRPNREYPDDDVALLSLIAALSLEDINEVRKQSDRGPLGGPSDDEILALQLFAEEATALDALASDIRFAQSLDKALESDARLLEELATSEEACRRDREFARALAEGRPPPYEAVPRPQAAQARSTTSSSTAAATHTKAVAPSSSSKSIALSGVAAASSSSASKSTAKARPESCVICRDPIEGPAIRAPCGDFYDVGCLVDLFRAAVVDESLFPPACCRQPFKLVEVRIYLDRDLQKQFDRKTLEFGTKNRVYCHRPTCSTFLGAATPSAANLLCTTCWQNTCGHCKAASHALSTRCTSAEDAAVVALAAQSGWKRCPGCGHLVELSIGCYHMTCRCRHQFCYLCTARWKTCTCDQWDENRLIAAAEDRVQRQDVVQAPARGGNAVEFRQRVAREAERLRVDHNCVHRWRYVVTAGICEGCGHYLGQFLFGMSHVGLRSMQA